MWLMFTTRAAKEICFINRFYTKCSFFSLLKSNWILKSILIDAHYRFSKMSCILIFNLQFTSRLQTLVHWLKHEKIKRKYREKKNMRRDYDAKYYPLGMAAKNVKSFYFDGNLAHFHCFESACISFYFVPFALCFASIENPWRDRSI